MLTDGKKYVVFRNEFSFRLGNSCGVLHKSEISVRSNSISNCATWTLHYFILYMIDGHLQNFIQ